jgi:hypothetical protein
VIVVGVGLNKTGTTSFGNACKILGMSRLGWNTSEQFRSHDLLKLWDAGKFDELADIADQWDALEGFPWSLNYPQLAERFPEAKFVLTRRITPDKWLGSVKKHVEGSRGYGMHTKIFGSMFPEERPDLWLDRYDRQLTEVRACFAGTDRLLEVCWEEGDGWPQLCRFLGLPVPDEPFPHSNPAGSNRGRARKQRPRAVRKAAKLKRRLKARLT